MKKKADYFLFFVFIAMILSFYSVFILGQKEISETENRTLAKLPIFQWEDFKNQTFQSNLENAITDQLLGSEPIKKIALETRKDAINVINYAMLSLKNTENENYYVAIAEDTYKINNEDWLVNKIGKYSYEPKSVEYFNQIKGADKYLYFIESDLSKMYNEENDTNQLYENIINHMELTKYSKFNTKTFEDYKNYFYKGDHHWNHKGQYEAYQEIIKLLGIEEGVKITQERQYDAYFLGSKAREASEYNSKEKFTVYQYDNQKPIEVYIDGNLGKYGKREEYDKGEYETKLETNHYGEYYGGDYAEVIYDFKEPQKENLLIISNSYSNAINEIIASHFNKTYIIDLRSNTNFNANEYVKQKEIDKILILGNMSLFSKDTYFKNIDLDSILK